MDDSYFKKIAATVIILGLAILSFFMLRSILLSIIMGFILAFIFSPIYNNLLKISKSKNFSSILIGILFLLLIIVPLWFFTPMLIDESIKLFVASQEFDIVTPLKTIFPNLFSSDVFSKQIDLMVNSFVTKITSSFMTTISESLFNLPVIIMQTFVIFFTFFYVLRDNDKITAYVKSILPFSKDIEKKLFVSTKDITFSVLFGYVVIGTIQGTILGIGFFLFGVPNALLLSLVGIIAGIFPIIGPMTVGVPVAIYMLLGGESISAFGVLIFTFISSMSDHLFRPFLVSRKTHLHPALVLIGMVGGFLLFGLLGFILGPLILAYLIIIVEIYRNKNAPSALIQTSR